MIDLDETLEEFFRKYASKFAKVVSTKEEQSIKHYKIYKKFEKLLDTRLKVC